MTKKELREKAIKSGRRHLRAWFQTLLRRQRQRGAVYYTIPSVSRSGMSRTIKLYRVQGGDIEALWPAVHKSDDDQYWGSGYAEALDAIAKDWGFDFKRRAFRVDGCGMDMVFALVDGLGRLAGLHNVGNRLERRGI